MHASGSGQDLLPFFSTQGVAQELHDSESELSDNVFDLKFQGSGLVADKKLLRRNSAHVGQFENIVRNDKPRRSTV